MANNILFLRLLFICLAAFFLFKPGYCGQANFSFVPDEPKFFNPAHPIQYYSYAPQPTPVFSPPPEEPPNYSQDAYFAPIEGFSQLNAGAASDPRAIDYQPEQKTITGVDAHLVKPEFNPEYPAKEEDKEE